MLKKILCGLLSLNCLLGVNNSVNDKRNVNNIYAASMKDASVSNVFNQNINNQGETILTNYATFYFNNLDENFGDNVYGSCSFVALGMLLSYYDNFCNDCIIDNVYDRYAYIDMEETPSLLDKDVSSPGIISEPHNEVRSLTFSQYKRYVNDNYDKYFHLGLINYASILSRSGYLQFDYENSCGISFPDLTTLTYRYLLSVASFTSNSMIVRSSYKGDGEEINDFILDRIKSGVPVLVGGTSSSFGNHTMIAYDYNEDTGDIYVHTGWKSTSGKSLNHISLNDLGISSIDSAISIDVSIDYSFDSHYYDNQGNQLSLARLEYPIDLKIPENVYMDISPKITWKSVCNNYTYDHSSKYKISFYASGKCILEDYVINENMYKINDNCWDEFLRKAVFSSLVLSIKLEICSDNYYSFNRLYQLSGELIIPLDISDTKFILSPDDYGFSNDIYNNYSGSYDDIKVSDDFKFRARVHRAGLIQGSNIVLSPMRNGYDEAYIDYQLYKGITRLDVELSYWREKNLEKINSSNFEFVIEELYGRKYRTLKKLSSDESLSQDRDDKTLYTFEFDHPVFRFRIRATSLITYTKNENRGRVCIGKMALYETKQFYYPLNGWELEYDQDRYPKTCIMYINCYKYAIDLVDNNGANYNPGDTTCPYIDSFVRGDGRYNEGYFTFDNIEKMLSFDADSNNGIMYEEDGNINYGYKFYKLKNNDEILEDGMYRIALFINSTRTDYHFYRQNADGTWSFKDGQLDYYNYDYSGNIIYDPIFCDRSSYTLPLNENYRFYAVSPCNGSKG